VERSGSVADSDEKRREYYIQKWQTAMNMHNDQISRFYVRSNVFLVINGGLLAIITTLSHNEIVQAMVSLLGAFFAFIWVVVNYKGLQYINDWTPVIEALEQETGIAVMRIKPNDKTRKDKAQSCWDRLCSVSSVFWLSLVAALFVVTYVCLGVCALTCGLDR
jgi:hypothetical protein